MSETEFDFSAWSAPVDHAELRALVAEVEAAGQQPEPEGPGAPSSRPDFSVGIVSAAVGVVGVVLAVLNGAVGNSAILTVSGLVVAGAALVGGIYLLARNGGRFRRRWQLYYRSTRFAADNGLEFAVSRPMPDYEGMLFHMPGDEHGAYYAYSKPNSPVIEAGLVHHTRITNKQSHATDAARQGNQPQRHSSVWGYIVVEVPVSLPMRTLLRSNAKASEGSVPLQWAQQRLGPAIPVDDVYSLYGPVEWVGVAQQVFTPRLVSSIEALEKKYSPVNAELYENHLYVFSKKPFDMYDPETVRLVFDTIAAALPATTTPGNTP